MNFDDLAKEWDSPEKVERGQLIALEIEKHLGEAINLNEVNFEAMEFGCGTGLVGLNLRHIFKNITFIDVSSQMLDILEQKVSQGHIDNVSVKKMDLTDIQTDISELKYDVIFASMALHHIEDVDFVIGQFYKMLNSNGQLLIADLNEEDGAFHAHHHDFHGHNGFSESTITAHLKSNGFEVTFFDTVYNGKRGNDSPFSLFLVKAQK